MKSWKEGDEGGREGEKVRKSRKRGKERVVVDWVKGGEAAKGG